MSMKLYFHHDAGHGWIAVPRHLLWELGIDQAISPFSYLEREGTEHPGGIAYLEEDCDAAILMHALKERGMAVELVDLPDAHWSPIRNLPLFPAAMGWDKASEAILRRAAA